ncbi:MAG: P-type Ca2+ transporter type [Cryptosporangiaceae bacterium]|nr:P-type Ca2+ transporter type [Cryptosporangiaceae bacterium]
MDSAATARAAPFPAHELPATPRPENGLSAADVLARRATSGPNITPDPPRGIASRIGAQLRDPMVMLLIVAMAVTVALADVTDAIVIAIVITVNTVVGIAQEARADRAVDALRQLAAPAARVRRDGREQVVPAADVVPGDVVLLDAGDIVPADVRLAEAACLQIDEASLTGESDPVGKPAGADAHAGTIVTSGRGTGIVTRTGASSALGRIAALVAAEPVRRTPLQKRLTTLSWTLGITAVALSAIVLVAGLVQGRGFGEMLLVAISLTVAAVPESLPAVVTVALAMGAYRMARRSAIVRNLPAVETLGSVTVLAADKTGTVTEGRMTAEQLVTTAGTHRVSGTGYDPAGDVSPRVGDPVLRLARDILLCNDATLVPPQAGGRWTATGDPMEAALLAAAHRCGIGQDEAGNYPWIAEVPFDAARHRMTTAHGTPDGRYLVTCKGSPESVLVPALLADPPDVVARFTAEAERLASGGYRVLAVADTVHADRPPADRLERGLHLAGLVALVDPVREGTDDVVRVLGQAGIRLILITGDHPATASAVADRIGLPPGRIVSGIGLDQAGVDGVRVFARTRPEQKLTIVGALQEQGHVVAMTGDGVNDAPALRRADIGVAMGLSGTEAARQAGDLVLADDNLATVTHAVEEGRRIYANVRRFLGYALSGGLAEVLVMMTGPWLGFGLPLLPAQILWINMLTHGLPGVALGAEPAERGAMRQPPRPPGEAMLGAGLWRRVAATGTAIAAVSTAAALLARSHGLPWQTMLFTTLGFAQLGVAFAVRSRRVPGTPRNPLLPAAVALSVVLQVAAVLAPPLQLLLGTHALGVAGFALCVGFGVLPGRALAASRWIAGRRSPSTGPSAAAAGPTGQQGSKHHNLEV